MRRPKPRPWWAAQGRELLAPRSELSALPLSALWDLSERLGYLREHVDAPLLALDFAAHADLAQLWAALGVEAGRVEAAVALARELIGAALRSGALGPAAFRSSWESLGFVERTVRASTAADDHLEALFEVPRLATGEERPAFGQVNLASRAVRISEFLAAVEPGPADVLYDLGSGCGKFVATVAASSQARVIGVEAGASYVASSHDTAARLGITNAEFICADVRDADLSGGNVFYLFHPFYGAVAEHTAGALAKVAAAKAITVYLQGPRCGFAEHFEAHVQSGAFATVERRGQVTLLRSVEHGH